MLHRSQRRSRGVKVFLLFALALFLPTATSTTAAAAGLSAGATHACAAKTDGTVWCWGSNDFGELGVPGDDESPTPQQVPGLTGVTAVSVGSGHSCALISGGTVKCWGQNVNGQIGDGTGGPDPGQNQLRPVPTTVSGLTDATAIASGAFHTCALRAGGTVQCWGFNAAGQLGDGSTANRSTPAAVQGLSGVGRISAGSTHTCAITSATVQCWGNNGNGQLGADTPGNTSTAPVAVAGLAGITAISAGSSHTCAINMSKSALCWGSNDGGQLGDGTKVSRPTAAGVPGLTSVQSVAAGGGHTCATKDDGTAVCWGTGTSGELGNGSTADSLTPSAVVGVSTATSVVAGPNFNCALLSNQTASCWGDGYFGQTGNGFWSGTASAKTPLTVPGLASVSAVGSGVRTACAVASSVLQCWGWGGDGNLGSGVAGPAAPSPLPVNGIPSAVSAVGTGFVHSCALTTVGTVYCWGNNFSGQLGNGSTVDSSGPVPVSGLTNVTQLAVGTFSTCAVTSNGGGQVWCWGGNDTGQLGNGSPVGDQSSNIPVQAAGFSGAQRVSVGNEHACAVDGGGDVWCWGSGDFGQLGDASGGSRSPVASGVTGAQAIGVGIAHSCAWLAAGAVQCWGDDSSGQLGDGPTDSSSDTPVEAIPSSSGVTALAVGGYHACVLLGGTAKCWGNNSLGQIGNGTLTEAPDEVSVSGLTTATALTAGFGQSCATLTGGSLQCWGDAYYGQAGNGASAGNFSLTGLAAPVTGLTSIIPDPVAELPKGPPSQPDPPVTPQTPQPPVVVPPVVDPPKPTPTLLLVKNKLKITKLLLTPRGKSCPKKLTLTVSSGKTKQSGSVKTKKVTENKKTKCSVTASFTIKSAKLKKAKSLKVRLSGKGIKTLTKTVKVTAAPKAA